MDTNKVSKLFSYLRNDTARYYSLLPIGSTVAVQGEEDSDRWTHGTKVGKGD